MDIATDIEMTLSDVRTVHFACVNLNASLLIMLSNICLDVPLADNYDHRESLLAYQISPFYS